MFKHELIKGLALFALFNGAACGRSDDISGDKAPSADVSTRAVSQTIRQLEHEWAQAYLRKDIAWYDRHVAREFRMISDGRIIHRAEMIDHMQSSPPIRQIKIDQVDVRVYGQTAVATVTDSFTSASGKLGKLRMTDIWTQSPSGGWVAVHSHETALPAKQ